MSVRSESPNLKPRLREMPICAQRLRHPGFLHHDKGNAIHQSPGFILPGFVESKAFIKQIRSQTHHFYVVGVKKTFNCSDGLPFALPSQRIANLQ